MPNFFTQLISKLLTSVFSVIFLLTGMKSGFSAEEIKTPEDFTPILRFVACSDIHLNGEENQENAIRFANLLKDMNEYSENAEYKNLDAVMVVGDFTGGGAEKEYEIYNKILDENLNDSTQVLTVLGNHEFIDYRDVDASVGYDVYKKYVNENVDTDVVINGYHFIGVSYAEDGKSFTDKILWLEEKLAKATLEDPTKPIFVYQHPHPAFTVYGSGNWGDFTVRTVLDKYPQVVDFSGHSHYFSGDPRSVWQGEFTAVGCGALKAFMGNLNYVNGDEDAPGKSGGAWVVEVDAEGNVSMKLYDAENRIFFSDIDYYFTNLSDSSKRTHNWHQQKARDTEPRFPEHSEISSFINEEGEAIITFPQAKGYYSAENYKITVKNSDNKKVYEGTVISEYVRATDDNNKVNLGTLPKGDYTVKVTSYSPYATKGKTLKNKITVK